ncbi:MAG: aminoacyl-tRNA hydrolase [Candidatus Nanopelagicales bacterium]
MTEIGSEKSNLPWLVVGLGNPGPKYELTRHNIGYLVLDVLAEQFGSTFKKHPKAHADIANGNLNGIRVELLRSRSYMNESGGPVKAAMSYSKIAPERLIVVHDEMDIPFDSIKIKVGGGNAGHNGLKSISGSLNTPEYARVRMGVGRPPGQSDGASHVLKQFNAAERKILPNFCVDGADAVESIITRGLEATQNEVHSR